MNETGAAVVSQRGDPSKPDLDFQGLGHHANLNRSRYLIPHRYPHNLWYSPPEPLPYRNLFRIAFVALILLAAGGYRTLYRLVSVCFHRKTK